MTSRISLDKLIRKEFRYHIISIFASVVVFGAELLFFYFEIQRLIQFSESVEYYKEVIAIAAEPTINAMVPTMILAVFLSIEYFGYLHSQKKTDFYMSLPLRRKEQFWLGVLVCGIIFFIPCVCAVGAECIAMYATGYGNVLGLKNMFWMLVCKILTFWVCFLSMTLAMIMTGHLVTAVLGFGAFCTYISLILKWLFPVYKSVFFKTYIVNYNASEMWDFFSPVMLIHGLTRDFENWSIENHWHYLVACIVFIIIIGWITQKLYMIRPAEAAGRAMAISKMNTTIRFLIVIPLALYCGWIFYTFAPTARIIWLFIGTLCGTVFLHGIVESVFQFDIKGMLCKKKQLCVSVMICCGFILVFQFDLLKYDEYIPVSEQVEAVHIIPQYNGIDFTSYLHIERSDGISGETLDDVLEFVEVLAEQNEQAFEGLIDGNDKIGYLIVTYQMKNGKTKERRYHMNLGDENVSGLLNKICATQEFKKDFCVLYDVDSSDIKKLIYEDVFTTQTLSLSEDDQEELLAIYLEELKNLSFTDMEEVDKIARFQLEYKESANVRLFFYETCDIYSNFVKTRTFLEKHGVIINGALESGEIVSLEIYPEYTEDNGKEIPGYIVEDQNMLSRVKDELIMKDLYDDGYVQSVENVRHGNIEILLNGNYNSYDVWIRKNTEKILETAIE